MMLVNVYAHGHSRREPPAWPNDEGPQHGFWLKLLPAQLKRRPLKPVFTQIELESLIRPVQHFEPTTHPKVVHRYDKRPFQGTRPVCRVWMNGDARRCTAHSHKHYPGRVPKARETQPRSGVQQHGPVHGIYHYTVHMTSLLLQAYDHLVRRRKRIIFQFS
jgi:hypothetical protein